MLWERTDTNREGLSFISKPSKNELKLNSDGSESHIGCNMVSKPTWEAGFTLERDEGGQEKGEHNGNNKKKKTDQELVTTNVEGTSLQQWPGVVAEECRYQ